MVGIAGCPDAFGGGYFVTENGLDGQMGGQMGGQI